MDEIARQAGVGPGTLYRHFPTKEALIEAVVHHRLSELADYARSLGTSSDPGDALMKFIDRLVIHSAPKRDLVDALTVAGADLSEAVTATAASMYAEIAHLLRRAQQQGAVRCDIGTAELIALLSGVLIALQPKPGRHPDPQLVLGIIRDGLQPHHNPTVTNPHHTPNQ